jgi:hypothetical protein
MSLQDAVKVLRDQAAGRPLTDKSQVIAAALALEAATLGTSSRDLLDAVAGLMTLATGGALELDQLGRERAAHLAAVVAALNWRRQHGYGGVGGVVVLFDGEVQGWVNELRNPEQWQPSCVAVNEAGDTWVSTGGDEQIGARMWKAEWADGRPVLAS